MGTEDLAQRIMELGSYQGYDLDCQLIPGEIEVLQITVSEFDTLPVFVSVTDNQILCITYLFTEKDVIESRRTKMLEEMLELNIPMPLSSFAKIEERYVVFGALAIGSGIEEICHELITLIENGAEALLALEEFLE
jgi:uncharacterized protein YjfI (DUF2170 family)